ncbi:uncharacterized protein DFL_003860 [Arthrobotrys flagrans]|uniref:Nephrocystin 3-like N-terminal domain-containing protein n=1 Tax=Arthrobotrys flagrans TaxID=97331 RepID=A0A437A392_ARTFL|nr:hypothetical protein DFL_003860 [Arthrobotrys flagrans]
MGGAPPNPDEQFLEALIDGDTNTEAGITPPEPGTCEWILSESKFTDWKMGQENYPLWIHGYGGCGKSTLCSFLIKEQQKWAFPPGEVVNGTKGAKKTIVAGCFCPKRQTPEWILRVLLYEILKQNRGLIDKSSPDFWQASSDNGNEHPILNSDAFDSAELLAKLLGASRSTLMLLSCIWLLTANTTILETPGAYKTLSSWSRDIVPIPRLRVGLSPRGRTVLTC